MLISEWMLGDFVLGISFQVSFEILEELEVFFYFRMMHPLECNHHTLVVPPNFSNPFFYLL